MYFKRFYLSYTVMDYDPKIILYVYVLNSVYPFFFFFLFSFSLST